MVNEETEWQEVSLRLHATKANVIVICVPFLSTLINKA